MHSKLLLHALQHFGVGKCPLQKNWVNSGPLQKKMEWTVIHSKKIGVGSCALQNVDIFGVECCVHWFFWSGLEVHSKTFGVDFRCTPDFWSELWVHNFYSKEVKNFGVERCPLQIWCIKRGWAPNKVIWAQLTAGKLHQVGLGHVPRPAWYTIYWSGQLPTPKKLEKKLFHSKLECMK
jgi:hypothetical protein